MRKSLAFVLVLLCAGMFVTVAMRSSPTSTICDHPFYPVRDGFRREYRVMDARKQSSLSTKVIEDVKNNRFTVRTIEKNIEKRSFNICENGGIASSRSGVVFEQRENGKVTSVKGIQANGWNILPPVAQMRVGQRWIFDEVIEFPFNGQSARAKGHQENHVVAIERVRVPAGTFEAVKITIEYTTQVLSSSSSPRTATENDWYVRGIGLVKSETSLLETTELVSFR